MTEKIIKHLKQQNARDSVMKKFERVDKNHIVTRWYKESHWPYTDKLSLPQLAALRDSNAGHRKKASIMQAERPYDRRHPSEGWDQKVNRSDRNYLIDVMKSAQDEKKFRLVPQTSAAQHGFRFFTFYDLDTKQRLGQKADLRNEFYDVTDNAQGGALY